MDQQWQRLMDTLPEVRTLLRSFRAAQMLPSVAMPNRVAICGEAY